MSSPAIGGGSPRMPRQPGVPELIVDPVAPGLKKPNPGMPRQRIKLPVTPRNRIQPIGDSFPGPQPYAPIKQTKAVNKVYKTY